MGQVPGELGLWVLPPSLALCLGTPAGRRCPSVPFGFGPGNN